MFRQYNASPFRYEMVGGRVRKVGTAAAVGDIVYLQPHARCLTPVDWRLLQCREPWIVEAWLPRRAFAGPRREVSMTGGHLAQVRSLRTGARKLYADWAIRVSTEATEWSPRYDAPQPVPDRIASYAREYLDTPGREV